MAGLFGGAMAGMRRQALGNIPRSVREEERMRRAYQRKSGERVGVLPAREERAMPTPVASSAPATTAEQMGGLIGGSYKSPKARGGWDEIMADPFTALFYGRNGLDRKYEAQAAEDEARRMAPQMQWREQFEQQLPARQRYAAMTAPADLGKAFAETAAPLKTEFEAQVGGNGNYWSFNSATGKMEDTGVKAPPEKVNAETGSGLANGGVHSKERMEDGRILVTYRNGKQEIALDPSTGQPAIASDSFFAFDAGGVPVIGSRRSGDAKPYTTAEEVGTNAATIEGFKFLGKEQADAISVMPEAISTSNRAIASIDELLNAPGFNAAYGLERFLPQNQLPGSDAKNAQAIIGKLDGQFFVNAVTAMQVSLAPVSDADAMRLVSSISQLSNLDISATEARRVAEELKNYFRKAQEKAIAAAQRGPIKTPLANAPQQTPPKSWVTKQAERLQSLAPKPAAQVPEGVDPEDWKYMTDEQKALFQ